MRGRLLKITLAGLLMTSGAAIAYDEGLAQSYAELFADMQGAQTGQALHLMTPDVYIADLKAGKPMVALDIRTPGETSVFKTVLEDSLAIPLNELFLAENLARIPSDKRVVVLCRSGTRAVAAATALRHIGFDDVYILKGGYKELSSYLNATTANSPL